MIFMKCRLVSGSSSSPAPAGNSFSTHCRNSGVSANSSRLRQYCGPVFGFEFVEGIAFIGGRRSSFAGIAPSSRAPFSGR